MKTVLYRWVSEGVTDTPFSLNVSDLRSDLLHLLTEIGDVNHYEVVIAWGIIAPNLRIDSGERNDNVRCLSEKSQDIELSVGEVNCLILQSNFTSLDVDLERAELHKESFTLKVSLDVSVDTK